MTLKSIYEIADMSELDRLVYFRDYVAEHPECNNIVAASDCLITSALGFYTPTDVPDILKAIYNLDSDVIAELYLNVFAGNEYLDVMLIHNEAFTRRIALISAVSNRMELSSIISLRQSGFEYQAVPASEMSVEGGLAITTFTTVLTQYNDRDTPAYVINSTVDNDIVASRVASTTNVVESIVTVDTEEPDSTNTNTFQLPSDSTSRFSGAAWFNEVRNHSVAIAGLGGIGSHTAVLISRLQPSWVYLVDNDVVEEANLSGQFYTTNSLGKYKTTAIASLIGDYGYYQIDTYNDLITENSTILGDTFICGFDNMNARKIAFDSWLKCTLRGDKTKLFIDGRLSAETLQVFCIRRDDDYSIKQYKDKYLFDDYKALSEQCSYKQTAFMANMIAGFITNLHVNHCANLVMEMARPLPFFTEYDATTMMFRSN